MKIFLVLFLLGVSLSGPVHGKKFSMCKVARQMKDAGFQEKYLPDWMCLINSESAFDSAAMNRVNTDGSYDWGLYQINDKYWCSRTGKGGECNINCNGKNQVDNKRNKHLGLMTNPLQISSMMI